ncbi:hypothetical protein V6Z11_D11G215800 [Gossypium hirsutum]
MCFWLIIDQINLSSPQNILSPLLVLWSYIPIFFTFSAFKALSVSLFLFHRAGQYEIDGYVYNSAEEPKILMTGKWNESMSYQPCDSEGEPFPGTKLKEKAIYSC